MKKILLIILSIFLGACSTDSGEFMPTAGYGGVTCITAKTTDKDNDKILRSMRMCSGKEYTKIEAEGDLSKGRFSFKAEKVEAFEGQKFNELVESIAKGAVKGMMGGASPGDLIGGAPPGAGGLFGGGSPAGPEGSPAISPPGGARQGFAPLPNAGPAGPAGSPAMSPPPVPDRVGGFRQ